MTPNGTFLGTKPLRIAHVLNIFSCQEGTENRRVQEITLESIRRANRESGPGVEVQLFSAHFPEDIPAVPEYVRATANLDRSIRDLVECADKRKLPLIHDIIRRAYDATDADFLIYTNMDIAVYPGFYRFLEKSIRKGIDALAINRAQIPRHVRGRDLLVDAALDEILGIRNRRPHHGIDCVMFRREHFPEWPLSNICIGYPPIGQYLLENAESHAKRFVWFKDCLQTFHIGVDSQENSPWKKHIGNEIWIHNHEDFDAHRLFKDSAWERHGVTRMNWILRRARWLLRSLLPW